MQGREGGNACGQKVRVAAAGLSNVSGGEGSEQEGRDRAAPGPAGPLQRGSVEERTDAVLALMRVR